MRSIGNILGNILSWGWIAKFIFGIGDEISPASKPVVHLRMIQGRCCVIKGNVSTWVIQSVEEVFKSSNSGNGYVKLRKDGRFRFSRGLPSNIQQRIRNLITSQ